MADTTTIQNLQKELGKQRLVQLNREPSGIAKFTLRSSDENAAVKAEVTVTASGDMELCSKMANIAMLELQSYSEEDK